MMQIFKPVLLLIFAVIICCSFVGFCSYIYAYIKMKRSKIIGSVALLFFALMINNIFYFFTEGVRAYDGQFPEWSLHPHWIVVMKLLLATAVFMFVYYSLRTQEKEIIKVKQ